MLVKDLDNNSHNWNLRGNMARGKIDNKSSLHLRAREILQSAFPTMQILEEVPIPLRRSETLYLDFYLPLNKLCVEVHGEQHYRFVGHYHNNPMGFVKQKKRDKEKIEWCEINDITYVELPFDEDDSQWAKRINSGY
jgi:very-short-patch-repair endonuclease